MVYAFVRLDRQYRSAHCGALDLQMENGPDTPTLAQCGGMGYSRQNQRRSRVLVTIIGDMRASSFAVGRHPSSVSGQYQYEEL
jgi:hypothetical protein